MFNLELVSKSVDFYLNDEFIFTATVSKKGEVRVSIKSELGQKLKQAINSGERIEVLL